VALTCGSTFIQMRNIVSWHLYGIGEYTDHAIGHVRSVRKAMLHAEK